MLIFGGCHCGNISFILDWVPAPAEIPARACSCSFCVAHNGVWTSCPSGKLKVNLKNHSLVSRHSFATGTAQFHICSGCADVPVVTSLIDEQLFAVVNVAALRDIDPSLIQYGVNNFDGESEVARLARRRQTWIADVELSEEAV